MGTRGNYELSSKQTYHFDLFSILLLTIAIAVAIICTDLVAFRAYTASDIDNCCVKQGQLPVYTLSPPRVRLGQQMAA